MRLILLLALSMPLTAEAHNDIYEGRVIRVIDGDTIDARIELGFGISINRRIRFYGVNAPETRTLNLDEKARGLRVKDRLSSVLSDGDVIKLKVKGTGKFGRVLGIVYKGRKNVNALVIKWSKK